MAAAPWTVRLRERAVEAERSSRDARVLLRDALPLLAAPMHVADAPRARVRGHAVLNAVSFTGGGLAFTAATTEAAELLALRGAAADPTAPLPSVVDIPDVHADERAALVYLREARVSAEAAYNNVGLCCERLLTACNLLEHPGLPGVDGLVEAERAAAYGYLEVAEERATSETVLADVFPGKKAAPTGA